MSTSRKSDTIYQDLAANAELLADVSAALDAIEAEDIAQRINSKDHTVWRKEPEEISNRLGWLEVVDWMLPRLGEVRGLLEELENEGVSDIVLLGMGGSSLGPEVFARTFPSARVRLHVLDTTSPSWIRRVTTGIEGKTFHVLVASKSGTTIEVATLRAYFEDLARGLNPGSPGKFFTAITDPGTALAAHAAEFGYRRCFVNPPEIGGRYSALSCFGMVPATLLGVDTGALLERAGVMAEACRTPARENPGAILGALLGAAARGGRDKLTLLSSPGLESMGLWIEQLVAESTGKDGVGVVPVAGEASLSPACFGRDRLFVAFRLDGDDNDALDRQIADLRSNKHPVWLLALKDPLDLGAEMYRWEFATAICSHVLGVHPFDQPDVQAAKTRTGEVLDSLSSGTDVAGAVDGEVVELLHGSKPTDYVAFMAYGDCDEELLSAFAHLRGKLLEGRGLATTFGLGPRFLHSTGQLHKGGPGSVIAVQLVLEEPDVQVPGRPFSFGQLMKAQAAGDYAALSEAGKRVARIECGPDAAAAVRALADSLE